MQLRAISFGLILLVLALTASQTACDAADGERCVLSDGTYVPDPHMSWYAGAIFEVKGGTFSYRTFTDVLTEDGPPPPTVGTFYQAGQICVMEVDGKVFRKWIVVELRGAPALWTEAGYKYWKATGKIDPESVFYLEADKHRQKRFWWKFWQ